MGLADISSTQVWQAVQASRPVRQESFSEEAVTDIFRYGALLGSQIEYLPKVGRCMDLARQRITTCEEAGKSFLSGTVFIAGQMDDAKGRFRRSWHAPLGGVWLVTVLVNTLLPENSALYSLAAGVACCETVRNYGIAARIKWVNDVLAGGRKLAGILLESVRGPCFGEEYILLGIGLNVNNCEFPSELLDQAGAMAQFSPGALDLEEVGAELLANLAWNIGLLHFVEREHLNAEGRGSGGEEMHPILEAWRTLSDTAGRRVRFGFNAITDPQFSAQAIDIDSKGGLIMRLDDGSLLTEYSGEILYV